MTITINQAIIKYLNNITMARSQNTARSYGNALRRFKLVLNKRDLTTENTMVRKLPVDAIAWFAMDLKKYAPATESLYLTAVAGFYDYLAAENLADLNLPKLRMLIRQRSRRYGPRLPQFPRSQIEDVLNYAATLATLPYKDEAEGLRNLRDRALLLTLADTGLRVHEACGLRRGDIDWNEGKAMIIGKGDRQDVVRFSNRCMKAIRDYLKERAKIDGVSGRPLSSLPVFSRHDRGAGKKTKPITTVTGRNIVSQRVKEVLGSQSVGKITPHSFRHFFVTTVLHGSGGKLKLAQELARHRNIAVTQRYAHLSDDELDRGYWEIFEER